MFFYDLLVAIRDMCFVELEDLDELTKQLVTTSPYLIQDYESDLVEELVWRNEELKLGS